jgi:hypothetical protein
VSTRIVHELYSQTLASLTLGESIKNTSSKCQTSASQAICYLPATLPLCEFLNLDVTIWYRLHTSWFTWSTETLIGSAPAKCLILKLMHTSVLPKYKWNLNDCVPVSLKNCFHLFRRYSTTPLQRFLTTRNLSLAFVSSWCNTIKPQISISTGLSRESSEDRVQAVNYVLWNLEKRMLKTCLLSMWLRKTNRQTRAFLK